jgi:hypothetical protein
MAREDGRHDGLHRLHVGGVHTRGVTTKDGGDPGQERTGVIVRPQDGVEIVQRGGRDRLEVGLWAAMATSNAGTKFSVRMSLKGGRLNGWSDHERRRGLSESIAALVMVGLDLEGATTSAAAVVIPESVMVW